MQLDTTIDGTPCQVIVNYVPVARGARERVSGVPLEPDTQESFEILAVYDQFGRPAPWLARLLTEKDEERILRELSNG